MPKYLVLRFAAFTRRIRVYDWRDAEIQLHYWVSYGFASYSVEF